MTEYREKTETRSHRWRMHLFYWLVIATLIAGIGWVNRLRTNSQMQLQRSENLLYRSLERSFASICGELSGDLYSAVEADSEKLYLRKLTEMQIGAGQALILLSENGRQTPWITFWQSMDTYLRQEHDRILDGGDYTREYSNLHTLAELFEWLSEHSAVILDESMESLPEELEIPTLQTAFGVDKKQTRQVAMRVLGVRGGLKEIDTTPPGICGYSCGNARVDVMQSGELLYFTASFEPKRGSIEDQTAAEIFLKFAQTEGFGKVKIIDLYREHSSIHATLAPLRQTGELGSVPDLDRTMEIACTEWSGRVCYFSAGRYFSSIGKTTIEKLLSASEIEQMALKKGARIGEAFYYHGKLCLPLVYERIGWSGRSILCVDASSGESVDLFYYPHPRVGKTALF